MFCFRVLNSIKSLIYFFPQDSIFLHYGFLTGRIFFNEQKITLLLNLFKKNDYEKSYLTATVIRSFICWRATLGIRTTCWIRISIFRSIRSLPFGARGSGETLVLSTWQRRLHRKIGGIYLFALIDGHRGWIECQYAISIGPYGGSFFLPLCMILNNVSGTCIKCFWLSSVPQRFIWVAEA